MANSIRSTLLRVAGHKCSIISVTYKYTFLVQLRLLAMTCRQRRRNRNQNQESAVDMAMGLWGYDMGASISASSARQSTVNERNLNLLRASSIVMFGVMKCGTQIDTLTTPFRPNPCPPSHPLPSDPIQYQQLVRHGSIFLPDLRMPSSLAIQACPFITIPYLRIQPSHVLSPVSPCAYLKLEIMNPLLRTIYCQEIGLSFTVIGDY